MVLEHYKTELELAQYVSELEAQVSGYKALCERLQAQADEMRSGRQWISVEDRLPDGERGVDVLAYRPSAHEMPSNDPNVAIKRYSNALGFSGCHEVTHWMPLPDAPTPTNGDSHD